MQEKVYREAKTRPIDPEGCRFEWNPISQVALRDPGLCYSTLSGSQDHRPSVAF